MNHQRQVELLAALLGQGQADQAATVACHKVDIIGGDFFRRHQQVALVLAVLVVHNDDHLALTDIFDNFFGSIQFHKFFRSLLWPVFQQ